MYLDVHSSHSQTNCQEKNLKASSSVSRPQMWPFDWLKQTWPSHGMTAGVVIESFNKMQSYSIRSVLDLKVISTSPSGVCATFPVIFSGTIREG